MDVTFHYPPELFNLLIDTIPLLCRAKKDVILFFKGAGVQAPMTNDLVRKLNQDKTSSNKYEIARTVLERLNEKGEATLGIRRELLKQITEFEEFASCWPADQLKAKGLVAEIRRVINVKDSFTRMNLEREAERRKRQDEHLFKQETERKRRENLVSIKSDLFALFKESNTQKRGKSLEGVLERFAIAYTVSVARASARAAL